MTTQPPTPRREFLRIAGLGFAGPVLLPRLVTGHAAAADPGAKAAAAPSLAPLNRFPRMMQDWLMLRVNEIESEGNARRAALKTKADAEAYVGSARERIRKCFGPEPERTPLQARVTGVLEREGYRIEKVIFESRPGFLVTSNLYLPMGRSGPRPAVLVCCGHSENSKCAEAENAVAQELVHQGYVVLVFDPPGQGERYQYLEANDALKSRYGHATYEHAQAGNQMVLVGETSSAWFVWDGVRALDYLLTRPEVDARHVGVTGNSGGGMQTTYLCGLEPRLTMAAPSCWVTTIRRNAQNELTQDTEQCLPRVLAFGLDQSDFIAAFAPKPVVLHAQERDFFDVRGTEEAYARLKQLYTLLGKPDNIRLHIGPGYHSYPRANREATCRLFNAAAGIAAEPDEKQIVIEQDETLWCTARGNVAFEKSRTLFSFTREKSEMLARTRQALEGDALRKAVRAVLKMPAVSGVPDFAILRNAGRNRYTAKGYCTYAVTTEPGVEAIVTRLFDDRLMSRPPQGLKRAVLYVSHQSADMELREEPLVAELLKAEENAAFYACDVRGIGESKPSPLGAAAPFDSDYFFAANCLMLDRPLLGQKVFDVLRVLEWLAAQGHGEVHLVAKGWGALAATFAAMLGTNIAQVTLKHALRSFAEVAEAEDYRWPYAAMLPGMLLQFDLPDCYRLLASKKLRQIEPWGAKDGLGEK